jgi:hypothetical protein
LIVTDATGRVASRPMESDMIPDTFPASSRACASTVFRPFPPGNAHTTSPAAGNQSDHEPPSLRRRTWEIAHPSSVKLHSTTTYTESVHAAPRERAMEPVGGVWSRTIESLIRRVVPPVSRSSASTTFTPSPEGSVQSIFDTGSVQSVQLPPLSRTRMSESAGSRSSKAKERTTEVEAVTAAPESIRIVPFGPDSS